MRMLKHGYPKHQVHIVGCSPRSGTTLLVEMMMAGFEIDAAPEHEMSVLLAPDRDCGVLCTKDPLEADLAKWLLPVRKNLCFIFLLRDPRDVVVSRHSKEPDKYFSHLGLWKKYVKAFETCGNHPRFVCIRYEDLVTDPDLAQKSIEQRIPFLKRKSAFSEFHLHATPSNRSSEALLGLRPVATSSIGRWRKSKERVAAQIARFGSIQDALIRYKYETDARWMRELEGVEPDFTTGTTLAENPAFGEKWFTAKRRLKRMVKYALGRPEVRTVHSSNKP